VFNAKQVGSKTNRRVQAKRSIDSEELRQSQDGGGNLSARDRVIQEKY